VLPAVDVLASTAVEGDEVAFRLADPDHARPGAKLWCDLALGAELDLSEVPGGWELRMPLPAVDCLEYMFEIPGDPDPHLELDPGNPEQVDGAFGAHSWLALPSYAAPAWLDLTPVPGERTSLKVTRTAVGTIDVVVWTPEGPADAELPLLVAHDGPEMDQLGELTRYVGALIGDGRLPPMRIALLAPGARDERYAANPAYAAALTDRVLPRITKKFPTRGLPVLSGQSLGGVAALHAAWTSPGVFGGLLLQSGSFFTPALDGQESGYPHWAAVTGFVATMHAATQAAPGAPRTAITCGTAEENFGNNRLMADQLAATGVRVSWGEARQGHTWTCWRDLLDPHLTDLLTEVFG